MRHDVVANPQRIPPDKTSTKSFEPLNSLAQITANGDVLNRVSDLSNSGHLLTATEMAKLEWTTRL